MRRVPVVLHTLAVFCVLLSLLVAPATLLAQDPLPPCGIEHYDLTDPDWLAGNPGGAYLGNTNTAPDPCPPDIFLICNGIDTAAGHNGPDISSPPVSLWCGVPTFPPNKPGVNAGAACIGGDTRTATLSTAGGDSFQISGSPGLGVVNGTSATFTGLQEGVGYQFQGIASNGSGSSGWSDPTPPVYHDLSAPVTTADVVGQGDGQMYRSEVSVALLANDTGCLGVVGTTYTLDGVTSPYSGVFSVRGEGTHTLSFASTDGFHSEAPQTLTLFIDVTPPRTTVTQNGSTISVNATDNLSGVSVTMYRLNGGEMQGWFAPLTLPGGNHRIEFASVDFAGNAEAWQTAYYSIPYGGGNVGSQGVDAPVTGGAPVRGYPDWSLWDEGVPTFPTTPRIPHLDGRRGGGDMNPPVRYTPAVMPYVEGRRGGGSMNPPVRYVPGVEPERRGVGRGQTVWADNTPMGVPSVVASIPSGMDDRLSKAIAALSLAATVGAGAFSILEQKRQEQLERAKANRVQNAAQVAAALQTVSVAATISDAECEYNRLKAERAALREQWLQAEAERLKAEEERRLKEEAARYAAYLAALRREQAARRANAARVRGARMEDEMMAAEEAEMADAARERQRQATIRRRQQQQARAEARASREEAGWSAPSTTTAADKNVRIFYQEDPTPRLPDGRRLLTDGNNWWIDLEARAIVQNEYTQGELGALSLGDADVYGQDGLIPAVQGRSETLYNTVLPQLESEFRFWRMFLGVSNSFVGTNFHQVSQSPAACVTPTISVTTGWISGLSAATQGWTMTASGPVLSGASSVYPLWVLINVVSYAAEEVVDRAIEDANGSQNDYITRYEADEIAAANDVINIHADRNFESRYWMSNGNSEVLPEPSFRNQFNTVNTLNSFANTVDQTLSAYPNAQNAAITNSYLYVDNGQYYVYLEIEIPSTNGQPPEIVTVNYAVDRFTAREIARTFESLPESSNP